MRGGSKEPLYRKVNTRARGVHHLKGADFSWQRNTKPETTAKAEGVISGKMRQGVLRGLDYTPLFRFLLSKVGQDWDQIHSEALSRLDRADPIFWMVALREADRKRYFLHGDNSYFSGLFVDGENRLQLVDPTLSVDEMTPDCACCTHTLNERSFTRRFNSDDRHGSGLAASRKTGP